MARVKIEVRRNPGMFGMVPTVEIDVEEADPGHARALTQSATECAETLCAAMGFRPAEKDA